VTTQPDNGLARLVVEWGGSALDDIDVDFAQLVLWAALGAAGDPRLAPYATWLLSVTIVDDEEMAGINAEHRGIAASTDVLSFPQLHSPDDAAAVADQSLAAASSGAPLVLGDIVVSAPRVRAQAKKYGHSPRRELGYLLIHSVLHLLGHDHEDEGERLAMRAEEERILTLLALPRD